MLRITAPGFREFLVTDMVLVTRDVRRIDATLEVGGLDAAVQVIGGATALELETPRISDVRSAAAATPWRAVATTSHSSFSTAHR
jgi:hypothetical protein